MTGPAVVGRQARLTNFLNMADDLYVPAAALLNLLSLGARTRCHWHTSCAPPNGYIDVVIRPRRKGIERRGEREHCRALGQCTLICRGLVASVFLPMDQSGNVPLVNAQWTLL